MEYFLAFLGMSATVLGVRGATWDDHKQGWRKLTPTGWIAVAIAISVALVSILIHYRSDMQSRARREISIINAMSALWNFENFHKRAIELRASNRGDHNKWMELQSVFRSNIEELRLAMQLSTDTLKIDEQVMLQSVLTSAIYMQNENPNFSEDISKQSSYLADLSKEYRGTICHGLEIQIEACAEFEKG